MIACTCGDFLSLGDLDSRLDSFSNQDVDDDKSEYSEAIWSTKHKISDQIVTAGGFDLLN